MGWVWSERSCLYLTGVACVVVAILAFTAGHVAPFWVTREGELTQNRSELNVGLWFQCQHGHCESLSISNDGESLKTTRILQVLGLVTLVISLTVAISANCRRRHPGHSFFLESVVALGAVVGFSGSMVYLAHTREMVEVLNDVHYDWAFALNIAASVLALLAAAFIFVANILGYLHRDPDHVSAAKENSDPNLMLKKEMAADYGQELRNGPRMVNGPSSLSVPPEDYNLDPAVYFHQSYLTLQRETDNRIAPDQVHGRARKGAELDGSQGTRGSVVDRFPGPRGGQVDRFSGPRGGQVGGYPGPRGAERYGYPGRGWKQVAMKMTPPRGFYGEQSHLGVRSEPGGVLFQHAGNEASSHVFMLPRVTVRGHYEPGRGYPEYIML